MTSSSQEAGDIQQTARSTIPWWSILIVIGLIGLAVRFVGSGTPKPNTTLLSGGGGGAAAIIAPPCDPTAIRQLLEQLNAIQLPTPAP
jgi:hypothetical protein